MSATDLIQILMAFFGTLGFSMYFNVRGMRVLMNAAGGLLGWAFYLLVYKKTGSLFYGYFLTALFVTAGCEVLARLTHTPTTLMIVPMLFPEIPGGDLYNMAANLFSGDMNGFAAYAMRLGIEIGAMNLGIVLTTTFVGLLYYKSVWQWRSGQQPRV